MKLWVTGDMFEDGRIRSIIGVFSSEDRAKTAASWYGCFVGPVEMDVEAPKDDHPWPGSYLWPETP